MEYCKLSVAARQQSDTDGMGVGRPIDMPVFPATAANIECKSLPAVPFFLGVLTYQFRLVDARYPCLFRHLLEEYASVIASFPPSPFCILLVSTSFFNLNHVLINRIKICVRLRDRP